jgi:flagellar motor switch protein FliM
MAEVLSQSQIDALLSAAHSGGFNLDTAAGDTAEKKYRKYDFYSPRKFTKDRIKMLNSIFEGYARVANSRINARLHTSCEISVDSIEEQRYYEFSNALTESDVLAVVKVDQEHLQEDTPILLHMAKPVLLSMMDRMMGGDGAPDIDLTEDYMLTDLELNLYEDIIKDMLSVMGNSWENYIPLHFEYLRTEENPTLVQLIGYEETVVIVGIDIRFSNCRGRLSLCLPGVMLTNIFAEIGKSTSRHIASVRKSDEIFDSLRDSEMEVVAELARTQILVSDIYHLNVGDVINLNRPKDAPVQIKIGGRNWFSGRMGAYNKQLAIKIGDISYKA